MVEFISETTEVDVSPQEPEEIPEAPFQPVQSLETLVETHTEELQEIQADQEYIDETASPQGDYHQPEHSPVKEVPSIKEELLPLVYDEREQVIVVDIFDRYGQKEDKWWKKNSY